jgi:hypothetical protein
MKKIRGKDVMCLVVVSRALLQDDEPVELHGVESHFKIMREGSSDYFFDIPSVAEDQQEAPEEEILPSEVRRLLAQRTVESLGRRLVYCYG